MRVGLVATQSTLRSHSILLCGLRGLRVHCLRENEQQACGVADGRTIEPFRPQLTQDTQKPNVPSGSGTTNAASRSQAWSSSESSGRTLKETLSGPAIDGVTPRGLATADESNFSSGGSTILTVQVRDVNLPDGTVLGVTLDFTPVGSIRLAGRQGTMTANLGHFGVSRDQVRVKNGDAQILIGGFFQ